MPPSSVPAGHMYSQNAGTPRPKLSVARAGINKRALAKFGGEVLCFMSDEDVAEQAGERGITRAAVSMEKAARLKHDLIIAVGNAPTALVRLYELIEEKKISPKLIIGVPVGFVNVVASKELIMKTQVPYIVARGRKGGSLQKGCGLWTHRVPL